jgi:hypothetical protein
MGNLQMKWDELSEVAMGGHDIALVNLKCAFGLPGSEKIDLFESLSKLDEWSKVAEVETNRLSPQFEERPSDYGNSWAYFRILVMFTVLQRDIGIHYDPALRRDNKAKWTDSRHWFIHGVLQNKTGTCASLPPFYAAIGRRLGYPLKVVATASHLFLRWDRPPEARFNIECTSDGLNCYSDEYYLSWPHKVDPWIVDAACLLKSQHRQRSWAGSWQTARFAGWITTGIWKRPRP